MMTEYQQTLHDFLLSLDEIQGGDMATVSYQEDESLLEAAVVIANSARQAENHIREVCVEPKIGEVSFFKKVEGDSPRWFLMFSKP